MGLWKNLKFQAENPHILPRGFCSMSAVLSLPAPSSPEKLVDAKALATHLGFDVRLVRKLAKNHVIPSLCYENGARAYYRFHVSEVEEALRKKA